MICEGLAQTFVSSTFGKAQLVLLSLLSDSYWIDLYNLDSLRTIMKQTGRVIFFISLAFTQNEFSGISTLQRHDAHNYWHYFISVTSL